MFNLILYTFSYSWNSCMRGIFVIVAFITLLINSPLKSQDIKKVTFIIPKDQLIKEGDLKSLVVDLKRNKTVDSVRLRGLSFPVIIIEPYQDYLIRYNLTQKYIYNVLKHELSIPVWKDIETDAFYCKLSDYRNYYGNNQIDKIGLIPLESVELNSYVHLMQVANIYFKLRTDSVFFEGKDVYSLTLNYKGGTENGFKQLLNLINKYKIRYQIVSALLSEAQN